jgi:predicted short-subunit dehydrogenase-like oxidoreductase (DUF2520 family)
VLNSLTIAIIGPGRVGLTIAALANRRGLNVVAIGGRNQEQCEKASSFVDQVGDGNDHCQTLATDAASACAKAQLVFLTVPDAAIQPLCDELVENKAFSHGTLVAHVSGALPSSILSSAKVRCFCKIASAHPLQTFTKAESALVDLPGTHWFLEGDNEALEVLSQFVEILGGKVSIITTQQKALYHAASVMASNYITTLIDAAASIMEEVDIPRSTSLKALEPLIRSAVKNTLAIGPEKALTGPISRGDALTLRTHLLALEAADKNLTDVYQALGQHTVNLALRKGSINIEQAQILRDTLAANSKLK